MNLYTDKWHDSDLPDGVGRCPTCGRFVSHDDAYGDVEPGGRRGFDYIVPYCTEECAKFKWPPARCENHGLECCSFCHPEGW